MAFFAVLPVLKGTGKHINLYCLDMNPYLQRQASQDLALQYLCLCFM